AARQSSPTAKTRRSGYIVTSPRNVEKLPDRSFEARNRAFHALSRMRRDNVSLWEAAGVEQTTPDTVQKYLPAALRRSKSGQWHATKSDKYVRYLTLPGPHGPVRVRAHGS